MALSSLRVPALALTGSAGPSDYRLSSRRACEPRRSGLLGREARGETGRR